MIQIDWNLLRKETKQDPNSCMYYSPTSYGKMILKQCDDWMFSGHYQFALNQFGKENVDYEYFGCGGNREVFGLNKRNLVVKVPTRGKGILDNIFERYMFLKEPDKFAACRLLDDGLLLMEKLDSPMERWETAPPWSKMLHDGCQSGFARQKNGYRKEPQKLKIYDFAHEHWAYGWARNKWEIL